MKNVLRKLTSVKVWIALWSMALITYIAVKNLVGFNNLAMLAMAPIISYLGANVWEDKIHLDKLPPAGKAEGSGDEK
ncbi:MAG: hypothetical protein LBI04_09195 [Treponema sp.]|jgi:hypothetical protein|nr:hypothetical protein [Treponema sp.]